jgi:hypothetical protein
MIKPWLGDIVNTKELNAIRFYIFALAVFVPGITIIFLQYNSYIFELDILKLLFLSSCFSMPFLLISCICQMVHGVLRKETIKKAENFIIWWGFDALYYFYGSLFAYFVANMSFGFVISEYWTFSILFSFALVICVTLVDWNNLKGKKKQTKKRKKK